MAIVIGAKSKLGSGGTRSTAGIYVVHEFDSSGTFTPGSTGKVDIVAIGGGGSRGPQGPPSWGTGGGAGCCTSAPGLAHSAASMACLLLTRWPGPQAGGPWLMPPRSTPERAPPGWLLQR